MVDCDGSILVLETTLLEFFLHESLNQEVTDTFWTKIKNNSGLKYFLDFGLSF